MIQQITAILIILFFLTKLFSQWRKKSITINEMSFWMIFWILAALIIVFIKPIDRLVIKLGFSSSGINLAFYLAVMFLFYLIFKMRLKISKLEKDISNLARKITLMEK
ncbi:hypothetical protein CVU82_02600 [Candidatus Falkowbacteria bacterium HGW-Falkowbacteria-1]|jgi:hypothetical protein|uniref:DUF2304 domain-containing protein n=1 Tax=Candidatus Falkowbacteria bacterium HGW-Falkowbacteria-1 TaxID=2013768 RepID=A0A2N2E9W3_9BACT|nr:MAG: hypothetical protein CVU82_02600 [Candidatus Falkowbacteria bacterium HGW-Falkowbacteria-1]